MNVAEPTGLLSHTETTKKAAGAKGKTNGLERAPGKGKSFFFNLMTAKLGSKNILASVPDAVEALKTAAGEAAAAKAAAASTKKLVVAAQAHLEAKAELEPDAEKELAAGMKKSARLHAFAASNAAQGETPGAGTVKPSDNAAASQKPDAAVQVRRASSGMAPGADGTAPGTPAGAAAGVRNAAGQRAEPRIQVVDLRKKTEMKTADDSTGAQKITQAASGDKESAAQFSQRLSALRDPGTAAPQTAAASSAQPQTTLERLREMAGGELMKATSIILKDGGGEIRLLLKPESLGSVRIRMNLVDNAIEGRIIVDNSAVKHVIEGSIDALRRALTADGFQTASLQVSVGGQNADGSARQEQEPPAAVRRVTAQGFESNVPGIENLSLGDLLVDLFV